VADPGTDRPPSFPELYRVLRAFVSQCQRVRRAHPRGEISLKFHFGDKESESSVSAGDDEKMALFVVLMRPFERVRVLVRIARGCMRARHAEQVAEIDEKRVLVRPFGRAGGRPLGDEFGNGHQVVRMLRVLAIEPRRCGTCKGCRLQRPPPDEHPRPAEELERDPLELEGPAPSCAAC